MSDRKTKEALQVCDKAGFCGAQSDDRARNDSQTAGSSSGAKRKRKLADTPSKYRGLYRMAWKRKSRVRCTNIGWKGRRTMLNLNQCDTRVSINATGLSVLEYAMNTRRLSGKGVLCVGR